MKVRCFDCMKEYDDEFMICPHCGYERGTPPADVYMLAPGTKLCHGRFIVGTVIGAGGFAITYRAWDTKLDRMIAMKEFYPDANIVSRAQNGLDVVLRGNRGNILKVFQDNKRHFLEEARNTVKFNQHENIVHIYDFFEENQTAYYTMEYMDGMTLSRYLEENGGSIGIEETVSILLDVIKALKAVHSAGIIHRDIAPDNIFILKNKKVKLFDFGAARFTENEKEAEYDIIVKPGYAPPEQYDAKSRQGPWTDIYALGSTMYRAITGMLPTESTKRRDEGEKLIRPREIKPEIPEYIDACLTRAMSLEPAFRFKTVEQFEEVLVSMRIVRNEDEELAFRKMVRRITVSIVSVIILIGASIGFKIYDDKQKEAHLEPADIVVWVPMKEGEDTAETLAMYENMSAEFLGAYPKANQGDTDEDADEGADVISYEEAAELSKIHIEFVGVPESEYGMLLENPKEDMELPTLYRSDLAGSALRADSLEKMLKLQNTGDYYFWRQYETYFPQKDRVPLGINAMIVYGNVNFIQAGGPLSETNSREQFFGEESAVYIGTSGEYIEVQEALPGLYAVLPFEDAELAGTFTDCWSVSAAAGQEEAAAAKRLLYYWLGETAQDIFHVQHVNALPINKSVLQEYVEVNQELEFLRDKLEDMQILEENPQEYYEKMYQEYFAGQPEVLQALLGQLEE